MRKKTASILTLIAAASIAALVVAGLSQAASPPENTSAPTITGTATVGQTLTADVGKWNGATPISYTYAWRRCDTNGNSCSTISGSNSKTYVLKSVDAGNTLRVRVTAKNTDGSNDATSVPTAVVGTPPPTTSNGCPTSGSGTLDVGSVTAPARLVIDGQQVSPTVIGSSATTVTMKFHVSACGGRSVQGALVYATAVPFEQFNVPAEVATGSDGWATLTFQRAAHFPASARQQLLAVFVRARKSGENLLGGISSRRLVSFPVNLSD